MEICVKTFSTGDGRAGYGIHIDGRAYVRLEELLGYRRMPAGVARPNPRIDNDNKSGSL